MTAPTIVQDDGTANANPGSTSLTLSAVSPISSGSNSDRLGILICATENGDTGLDFTTATWDGTSLTKVTALSNKNSFQMMGVFFIEDTDFPSSSGDIVVNTDVSMNLTCGMIFLQVKDAVQESPQDEATANNVNSYSLSVTDDETLVIQSMTTAGDGTYDIDSPATFVRREEAAGGIHFEVGKIDDQSSGSVTLNCAGTATNRRTHSSMGIAPASPGGGSTASPIVVIV